MNRKKVLITGATSGIGKATAYIFAEHGWDLIITGRRDDRLAAISKEIIDTYHVNVTTSCFDIQNRSELALKMIELKSELSLVTVLVNNAGLALGKSTFDDGLESDWETMIDTNIKGLIYMTKEIIPYMKSNKAGHIINISSTAARDMYQGGNVYSATKSAVDAFTKSLRIDLLPHSIKVSSIAPGMVDTEFSEVRFHGDKTKAGAVYQGFESLHAEDVADAIYYIASRPEHVHIGDMLMTCTAQATSTLVLKN
jgi:3-hydroxy acid dehydrogenase / malonic semialdehyde reductase